MTADATVTLSWAQANLLNSLIPQMNPNQQPQGGGQPVSQSIKVAVAASWPEIAAIRKNPTDATAIANANTAASASRPLALVGKQLDYLSAQILIISVQASADLLAQLVALSSTIGAKAINTANLAAFTA